MSWKVVRIKIRKESSNPPIHDSLPETDEPMFSKHFMEQLALILFEDE